MHIIVVCMVTMCMHLKLIIALSQGFRFSQHNYMYLCIRQKIISQVVGSFKKLLSQKISMLFFVSLEYLKENTSYIYIIIA